MLLAFKHLLFLGGGGGGGGGRGSFIVVVSFVLFFVVLFFVIVVVVSPPLNQANRFYRFKIVITKCLLRGKKGHLVCCNYNF